jgi:putative heme-binding domain-containing protein
MFLQTFAPMVLAIVFAFGSLAEAQVSSQVPEIAESQVRSDKPATPKSSPKPMADLLDVTKGPAAEWLWGTKTPGDEDLFFFHKIFEGKVKRATLVASCDNILAVFINGKRIASSNNWEAPVMLDVTAHVKPGKNILLVEAANAGGAAGMALKLVLQSDEGKFRYLVSDKSWTASRMRNGTLPVEITTLGKMGVGPWMNVFANPKSTSLLPVATRNVFNVLPGFQVERLYTVPKGEQGSWVSLTTDPKGRLIASDQGGNGLYRITPPAIGSKEPTKVEKLDVKITSAQGMLCAFDSLYVSVNGGPGSGLYRCRDTNGDDQYDEVTKLKALQGGGEHGPHALRLSPDGKSIYMVCGNHTNVPEDFNASRLPRNWGEDLLLPRQWDARGHARGKLAPGGWIAKTDPDGKHWEIVSSGYRNSYDMDFNADGELFVYDADMEWDLGSPWYRPTRVVHATSGSEFGWRSGTGKWPNYYVDSLPKLVDIGPGSPVGATFGYGTKFPAKYQKAFYILDWTFGTMYAIHIKPQGASYTAVKEEFVSRAPLPLTDAVVGADGAMYFTVGGRGAQSELFRVTYIGKQSTAPAQTKDKEFAELRALRHQLEALHRDGPLGVPENSLILDNLGHADRHIRYAARIALEHRLPKNWQTPVLGAKNANALITGAVAVARQGNKRLQDQVLTALARLDYGKLSETQQLDLLRTYQLVFIRMGKPDQQTADALSKRLEPHYPAKSDGANRELVTLLAYLNSPKVIDKTLAMMEKEYKQSSEDIAELLARNAGYGGTVAKMLANKPEIQKIHYAFALRTMRYGWTLEQRKKYFDWMNGALKRSGGASYQGFINNIKLEAVANLSEAEKKALAATTAPPAIDLKTLPKPKGPGKAWATVELALMIQDGLVRRNFDEGKRAFAAARCSACHRLDGAGGATGPDLTNVAGRFGHRDLSEALVEPSKVVSDQYRGSQIVTKGGKVINGRIIGEADGKVTVMTDPYDALKIVTVAKDDIEESAVSKISLMPNDLLKPLNRQEVLDLMAYLLSRGNPNDRMFAK